MIEGLSMSNTDSIRAQTTDGGRELILENRGAAKAFNLRLRSGLKAEEVGQRTGLQIDAGSVVLVKPSNWSPAVSTTAPIHLEVLDSTWQKILKSSIV